MGIINLCIINPQYLSNNFSKETRPRATDCFQNHNSQLHWKKKKKITAICLKNALFGRKLQQKQAKESTKTQSTVKPILLIEKMLTE